MKLEHKFALIFTLLFALLAIALFLTVAYASDEQICINRSSAHVKIQDNNAYIVANGCKNQQHKWRIMQQKEQSL